MPQHLKLIYGKDCSKKIGNWKSQDNLRKINFKKAKFTVNPARGNQNAGWTPKSLLEFRRWCHTACLMDVLQRLAEWRDPAGLYTLQSQTPQDSRCSRETNKTIQNRWNLDKRGKKLKSKVFISGTFGIKPFLVHMFFVGNKKISSCKAVTMKMNASSQFSN